MSKKISYEQIRNPWNMREGVIVFDIETNHNNDFSLQGKKDREFKCAVTFSYDDAQYRVFKEPEPFIEQLKTAKALVTYNGEGFDYIVLEKFGLPVEQDVGNRCIPTSIQSCDILHEIQRSRERGEFSKKYPSLDEMIYSHYEAHKTPHDPDDINDLVLHCTEDVKFTKMLYEEEIWNVPVFKRTSNPRWGTDYDDDLQNVIDCALPISPEGKLDKEKYPDFIPCPNCDKGSIVMYEVLRGRVGEVECPECEATIEFVSCSYDVCGIYRKEDAEYCPNCEEELITRNQPHSGYGAGAGYISSGRQICQTCKKGCYEWEKDDTPGFRDRYVGKCCFCGE